MSIKVTRHDTPLRSNPYLVCTALDAGIHGSAYISQVYHPKMTTLDLNHQELGITCRYLIALSMENGDGYGDAFNIAPSFVCKDLKLDQTPFVFKAKTARGARGTLELKKHDETKWDRDFILVYMHDV